MLLQVTMSYMEIYNENIRDLLNPSSGYLDLRDDTRGRNVQVSGLTEISTNSTEEVRRPVQSTSNRCYRDRTITNSGFTFPVGYAAIT